MEVLAILIAIPIYFLPTIIVCQKAFVLQLFLLNLLLGWTIIGWIVALTWSVKKQTKIISQSEANINAHTIALLEKLSRLQKEGIITEEEFVIQKQKLINNTKNN
jgi:hypothetical protein